MNTAIASRTRLATKQDVREMERRLVHRLTLRLGGIMTAGIVVVATLVKLLQL